MTKSHNKITKTTKITNINMKTVNINIKNN